MRGGLEGTRGGRSRGLDRGRGPARGGRGPNGVRGVNPGKTDTASTTELSTWEPPAADASIGTWDQPETDSTPLESSWENVTADAGQAPAVEDVKPSSKPDGTRSWASMFSKPAPVSAPPKAPRTVPSHDPPTEQPIAVTSMIGDTSMPGLPPPVSTNETFEAPLTPSSFELALLDPPADITPSKDELTETNLEQVLDVSGPPPSGTVASTMASTIDPQSAVGGATSLHSSQQQASSRPPLGGFATSAYKATGMPGRTPSYNRRILEQQEAVVMPGKHAVDRAAVQFGSMGLNGSTEDDVDSDREDAETRAQPPQTSPVAPRAALPPAPLQQPYATETQVDDPLPTPRQAPGLPPVNQATTIQQPNQALPSEQGAPTPPSQITHAYNQLNNRYGSQVGHEEISAPAQKAYEPFGQQMQHSQQYDGYTSSSQAQNQQQHSAQPQTGGFSSASNDISSYYTSDNQRNAYQTSMYGNYTQQSQQNAQDTAASSQQRAGNAFGTSTADQGSQYATTQAPQQPPSRFGQTGEAQTSGHSTPNPSLSGQQQPNQPHHLLQQQQQGQGQAGGQHGGYPYGHPYYASPYYSAYMNQVSNHPYGRDRPMFDDVRRYDDLTQNHQFGYGGGQGGYGGPFGGAGGKQGMYGQPHQGYQMSPQTLYDQHSASPANTGAFAQNHSSSGRDSAAAAGLGNYARTTSTQPSENPQQYSGAGGSGHGTGPGVFGRSASGYTGQDSSGLGTHMGQQGGHDSDSSKVPGGPSPALGQPGGRSGSTTTTQGQGHSQQGYGYMSHPNPNHLQGSQYPGSLGGGHHQSVGQNHQGGGYGAYGTGYGSGFYGNNQRGGWGANYGH